MTVERAGPSDRAAARAIVHEYYEAVGVVVRDDDESFTEYLEDPGGLWTARDGESVVGCIALRALLEIPGACEVKRLYVRPGYRGRGIAEKLLDALHEHARRLRFGWAYLDTKDDLLEAIRFYERHGYRRCERYNDNPQATIFMRRPL
jgi:ribosomal protein S18 acetylase RimI-like enzyme